MNLFVKKRVENAATTDLFLTYEMLQMNYEHFSGKVGTSNASYL